MYSSGFQAVIRKYLKVHKKFQTFHIKDDNGKCSYVNIMLKQISGS